MKITIRALIIIIHLIALTSITWGLEEYKSLWFPIVDDDVLIEGDDLQRRNLPKWIVERSAKLGFDKKYDLSLHMNPFYLPVDFDNDNIMDIAVWVKERSTGKKGVAIFIKTQNEIHLAGAGKKLGMGDGDYSWANLWSPFDKDELKKSHWEKNPPGNIGQGIVLRQFESSSGAIYWNGKTLEWYQESD